MMAGLMLADKTAGLEDKLRELETRLVDKDAELARMAARPAPEPQKIEVAVIPPELTESLSELAARAESLADAVEDKLG